MFWGYPMTKLGRHAPAEDIITTDGPAVAVRIKGDDADVRLLSCLQVDRCVAFDLHRVGRIREDIYRGWAALHVRLEVADRDAD